MTARVDDIAAAFATKASTEGVDYSVLPVDLGGRTAHLATSRDGFPSLLIPLRAVPTETLRLTRGLALRSVSSLEFALGDERWREPAAVVECRDGGLVATFAGMVASIVARIPGGGRPSWENILSLFAEWESLLARRLLLSAESELGLWGELWILKCTTRLDDLLAAWRGPESESFDFFLDGRGFEIKTGRQAGVHMVSQQQVAEPLGEAPVVVVSLLVAQDPMRGQTLAALVRGLAALETSGAFEEKLAAFGYLREDEAAYTRSFVVLEPPLFFRAEDVPRVRAADPGVSHLRFRVELPRERALVDEALPPIYSVLGFDPTKWDYPCV